MDYCYSCFVYWYKSLPSSPIPIVPLCRVTWQLVHLLTSHVLVLLVELIRPNRHVLNHAIVLDGVLILPRRGSRNCCMDSIVACTVHIKMCHVCYTMDGTNVIQIDHFAIHVPQGFYYVILS